MFVANRIIVPTVYFQSKFQKHQAFEAEVSANQERVLETINLAEGKQHWKSKEQNGLKLTC